MPHFLHNLWRKIFVLLYSINWWNFIVWLPLLCEILASMCIAIVWKPGCDVKPVFLHGPKNRDKNLNIVRTKRPFLKNIFHHFKGLSINQNNTIFFGRWESDFNIFMIRIYFDYHSVALTLILQKQPARGDLRKKCSENMQQIYRRTPMPKFGFIKVAKQLY